MKMLKGSIGTTRHVQLIILHKHTDNNVGT